MIISFPDSNLQCKIREKIKKTSGDIYISDVEHIEDLQLDRNNIKDLEGIQYLTNLIYLDLRNNKINDISPLAKLTNLTDLYLSDNYINDISPLAGLTNLISLDLSFNEINDVSSLAELTNLTKLHLRSNEINDISPLAGLTNLTSLYLNDNQILDYSPIYGYFKQLSDRDSSILKINQGKVLKEFQLLNVKTGEFEKITFGKPMVIFMFSTTCPYTIEADSSIKNFENETGAQVISVSYEEIDTLKKIQDRRIYFMDKSLDNQILPTVYPQFFFLDSNGVIQIEKLGWGGIEYFIDEYNSIE